jgi:hypothetical protein
VNRAELLQRGKEDRNILHAVQRKKDSWIVHIMLRSCLLKHVIEGKIEERTEVTERSGRRHKQLPGDLREKRG